MPDSLHLLHFPTDPPPTTPATPQGHKDTHSTIYLRQKPTDTYSWKSEFGNISLREQVEFSEQKKLAELQHDGALIYVSCGKCLQMLNKHAGACPLEDGSLCRQVFLPLPLSLTGPRSTHIHSHLRFQKSTLSPLDAVTTSLLPPLNFILLQSPPEGLAPCSKCTDHIGLLSVVSEGQAQC